MLMILLISLEDKCPLVLVKIDRLFESFQIIFPIPFNNGAANVGSVGTIWICWYCRVRFGEKLYLPSYTPNTHSF